MTKHTHMQPVSAPRGHKFSTCVSLPSPRGHKFSTCVSLPSPRGHKFLTCVSRPRATLFSDGRLPNRSRSAFTLVELLVVIGIIAILAALVTPAVMRAQATARNAAIKAEIDMLHMAIMNYKNEYGSFPPCYAPTITGSDVASRHVLRIFPRTADISTQVTAVNPTNALYGWLLGYTDNPLQPVRPGTRQKLYDFDLSRVHNSTGGYYPSGKPGSPYIYFLSGTSANGYGTIALPNTWAVATSGTHVPQIQVLGSGTTFFNADTFQILCAGRDEIFGNDDDLSNFWRGTRRDYLDSLNQ